MSTPPPPPAPPASRLLPAKIFFTQIFFLGGLWPLKTFACVYLRYRKLCGGGVDGNNGSGLW